LTAFSYSKGFSQQFGVTWISRQPVFIIPDEIKECFQGGVFEAHCSLFLTIGVLG
jgi:hypothetical protein